MKDITVTLDANRDNKLRLDAAIHLADKHDAHLTGVYYEPLINYSIYSETITSAIAELMAVQKDEKRNEVQELFDRHTDYRKSTTTFKVESNLTRDDISGIARLSDLVITEQLNRDSHLVDPRAEPEHLIMSVGRPVLIVPHIGYQSSIGEIVLIGWDKSREAARAIADSIPMLIKAKEVHVFQVVTESNDSSGIANTDMAEHLSRYDINVNTLSSVRNRVPIAETLLSRVADLGADLLVMGAYGHSRLREYAFGGTTRTILNSMTVPVLMTH